MMEYDLSSAIGLGGLIGLYSLLLSTDKSFQLNVKDNWRVARDVKRIFNIPDSKIVIKEKPETEITNWFVESLCDNAKVFSRYITAAQLNLFDKNVTLLTRDRPCIGFAFGGDTKIARSIYFDDFRNIDLNHFSPKFSYTKQQINKVFELCIDSGYDIITFNSRDSSLDHKLFMLNELCDCVIAYEGGIAHLAHCLKIPVIMFPWSVGHDKFLNNNATRSMLMHLDARTYFLESIHEIEAWNEESLRFVIENLKNNSGNNYFLRQDFSTQDIDQLMQTMCVPVGLRDFIKTHVRNLKVGG